MYSENGLKREVKRSLTYCFSSFYAGLAFSYRTHNQQDSRSRNLQTNIHQNKD